MRIGIVTAAVGLALMAAGPAPAQQIIPNAQQVLICDNADGKASPDQVIAACTALLAQVKGDAGLTGAALFNRGLAQLDKDNYAAGIADLDEAIRLDSADSDYWAARGLAKADHEQFDGAIADVTRSLQIDPKQDDLFQARGLMYDSKNDLPHALADYSEAIRLNPQNWEAVFLRGGIYASQNDFARAVADFDTVLGVQPRNASALGSRCEARAEWNRDLDKALADCNEALRLRPDDVLTRSSLALTQFRRAEYAAAVTNTDIAVRADPKDAYALYIRGLAKLKLGQTAAGNADLAAARAAEPTVTDDFAAWGLKP